MLLCKHAVFNVLMFCVYKILFQMHWVVYENMSTIQHEFIMQLHAAVVRSGWWLLDFFVHVHFSAACISVTVVWSLLKYHVRPQGVTDSHFYDDPPACLTGCQTNVGKTPPPHRVAKNMADTR